MTVVHLFLMLLLYCLANPYYSASSLTFYFPLLNSAINHAENLFADPINEDLDNIIHYTMHSHQESN